MIRRATAADVPALAEVLLDAVASGASVSFMADFSRSDAEAHFARWVSDPQRIVLAGVDGVRVDGTAQLLLATPPNQPHRAELAKMLVHRRARRRGLGGQLFEAICDEARALRRTLLTFDTVTGDAGEKLYLAKGAVAVGVIPDYAYFPDGRLCATTVFYKRL
ncbi:MAG TPA: GNAT family N-acetyltransferase [Myxococcales bacterium]|jgi:GNAT superfamily N-acetyltransferase